MKLRIKLLLILAGMWMCVSLFTYVYSRFALADEYLRLENKEMMADVARTRNTLNSMLFSVKLLNADWAQWDEAYNFMKNKNPAFIKTNLTYTTFAKANMNLILFFNTDGKLFYGLNYDLILKKFQPIPPDLLQQVEATPAFTKIQDLEDSKLGILKTSAGYVVLSAMPILTSERNGPIRGTLLMGYFFTNNQIERLSEIINTQVQFFPLPLPPEQGQNNLSQAIEHLNSGLRYYTSIGDHDLIDGYTFIRDINDQPIGVLRISSEREVYKEGIKTINSYMAIVIGIGILFLIAIWYLLRIFIIDPLISVSKQVIDINSESQFDTRIHVKGHDELTTMVGAINSLMEIIELTQEQLKYRILLRTEELEHLSKLNKNLYTEMTHKKETETKLREGEKILRQMAYYDILTGMPNRLYFQELLQSTIAQAARNNTGFAVLFLDADKFKSINDTYGHDIGDRFLKHTAKQITNSIRESDIASRLGGDEFIIVLNNLTDTAQIGKEAKKILQNVAVPLLLDSGHLEVKSTFSIGISLYPSDGKTVDDLERQADLAMYYAKRQLGNASCFYFEIKKIQLSNQ